MGKCSSIRAQWCGVYLRLAKLAYSADIILIREEAGENECGVRDRKVAWFVGLPYKRDLEYRSRTFLAFNSASLEGLAVWQSLLVR